MSELQRSILVYEPQASALKRTLALVEQTGYRAIGATTAEQATAALSEGSLVALLVAAGAPGVEFCHYLREFSGASLPIAALLGAVDETDAEVVAKMGADGYLRRPFTATALESFVSLARQLGRLRRQLIDLRGSVAELEQRLQRTAGPRGPGGFHSFEEVKDQLGLEVRRAKRYGYPLAVMVVGIDPLPAPAGAAVPAPPPPEVTAGLAASIAKSVRAIDMPIHFAAERILVFLPHTDLAGAEEVGRRVKRRIMTITYRGSGQAVQLTASVGLAGMAPGEDLTFSRLVKSALAALKAAQLKGGNRVMKRVTRGTVLSDLAGAGS